MTNITYTTDGNSEKKKSGNGTAIWKGEGTLQGPGCITSTMRT